MALGAQRDPETLRDRLGAWLRARWRETGGPSSSPFPSRPRPASRTRPSCSTTPTRGRARADGDPGRAARAARLPRLPGVRPGTAVRGDGASRRQRPSGCPRCAGSSAIPHVLGGAFYVMDAVDGEVPSEVPSYHVYGWVHELPPDRRARIWWQRRRGDGRRPRARLARPRARLPGRAVVAARRDRSPARLLGSLPRPGARRGTAPAHARRHPRLAARQRLHAAADRPVLGGFAPPEHDVPRRSGGGGARLGDGVSGRPRGRPRLVVLPRLGAQRGLRRAALEGIPGPAETLARYAERSAGRSSTRTTTRCSPPSGTA